MARLSYKKRARMPKREFALPSRRSRGKGGFPIPNASHARSALSRAAQGVKHGTLSSSAAAQIRAKVHRLFPSIGRGSARKRVRAHHRSRRR